MLNDITIGQYIPGDSPVHRADPRVKIILTLVFMVSIFFIESYPGFFMYLLFTCVIIVTSDLPFRYTLKGLKPIMFIVIFTALINILTTQGTYVFEWGFIHISREGIDAAVKLSLRLVLLVMGASLLTLTTTPISLTDGIEKLMAPLKIIKVPVHEIAMMMSIALRFIPTLLDETDKIIKAQSSRGADFDTGNIIEKAKSFIPVLIPLFISAFRRADELAVAMEARCYRGGVSRTRMKQLKLGKVDFAVSAVMILFTTLVLLLG
jgi:energy-coupling factor transport system permease protein